MKVMSFVVFLLVPLGFLSCKQMENKNNNIEVKTVALSNVVDAVEPPPPGFESGNFSSIKDWLKNICDTEKPKATIDSYRIDLFESEDFFLSLVGTEESLVDGVHYTKVVYEPASMYFKLPAAEYAKLTREELLNSISKELQEFTTSTGFKGCFLSEAKSFITDYNGKDLLH